MRILILQCILFSITFFSLKAQTLSSRGVDGYTQQTPLPYYYHSGDSSDLKRKWSLVKYRSISASYALFNGGSATVLSAPIGLQLNRRISNNLYAFAGVSAAPAYINFNQPGFNKFNPGNNLSSANNFGLYTRAEMGLMYVNDQRTFSISGSIGIERNSYPFYPPNRVRQQGVIPARY